MNRGNIGLCEGVGGERRDSHVIFQLSGVENMVANFKLG